LQEYTKTRFESKNGRSWVRVLDQLPARHRYLHFGTSIQGALDLNDTSQPVLEYIGLMAAWAIETAPDSQRILVGGLGACALWHALRAWRGKGAEIEVVENNPLIFELAEAFFRYEPQDGQSTKCLREFLIPSKEPFDLIFVDCYTARFMPPELLTAEFMVLLKSNLSKLGTGFLNVWNPKSNKICGHQIRTMLEVFGQVGVIAGKEDDNFVVLLPSKVRTLSQNLTVSLKGLNYPVQWLELENPKSWPDYLQKTQIIFDGNVWRFLQQLKE